MNSPLKRHGHLCRSDRAAASNNGFRFAASISHLGFPSAILFAVDLGACFDIIFFTKHNNTTSALVQIEPNLRKSESCGRFSSRFSTKRESWDRAMTRTFSSLASAF